MILKFTSEDYLITGHYIAHCVICILETHENPEQRMVKLHEMIDMCKTAAAQHARAAISVTQKYPQYSAVHAKNRDVIPQLYRDLFGSAPPSLINPTVKTCQQT